MTSLENFKKMGQSNLSNQSNLSKFINQARTQIPSKLTEIPFSDLPRLEKNSSVKNLLVNCLLQNVVEKKQTPFFPTEFNQDWKSPEAIEDILEDVSSEASDSCELM